MFLFRIDLRQTKVRHDTTRISSNPIIAKYGISGIVGDVVKVGVGVCRIVELGVGVAEDVGLGLAVGDIVGVEVVDVNPSARVAYAAPVGLTIKFAMF